MALNPSNSSNFEHLALKGLTLSTEPWHSDNLYTADEMPLEPLSAVVNPISKECQEYLVIIDFIHTSF